MPKIKLLSAEVASQIAAGEVIERPASALKELLENSLDAGAGRISVEAAGAGRKTLRVTDDGGGMDREDCERALQRHATSKISSLGDLESLRTFGFRGEALYALAAVSRLSIASTPAGASSGWRVEAEGGRILSSGPAPAVPGTTLEARDIFFNTPARLKFLRSEAFEKARLAAAIEEAALANPQVHISYKSEGRMHLSFPAEGPEAGEVSAETSMEWDRRRLSEVLGPEMARGLIPILAERPGMRLRLYVSPAEGLVATRNFQHWFVNRRPVGSRVFQQALYRAYAEARSKDRHPVCVAHLEVSPDAFDVNVHPGKREIRFKSERDVFELVSGLIASALFKSKGAASLPSAPMAGRGFHAESPSPAVREPFPVYRSGRHGDFSSSLLDLQTNAASALKASPDSPRWFTPPYRYLGQIEKSYLVFEASGGLFILDQHAAAERILYERYLAEISGGPNIQRLMLPLPIELPASGIQKILGQKELLSRLGFEMESFGRTILHVLSVPALFERADELKVMVHRLLDSLSDPARAARDAKDHAAATIACKAAVKAHDALGEREAMKLLEDLKDCRDGSSCPHGRRVLLALNREELARRFQRPGPPPL